MLRKLHFFLIVWLVFAGRESQAKFPDNFDEPLQVIAFGSCNRDELAQPLWPVITGMDPDLWIWLGDNVYADWYQPVGGERYRGPVDADWIRKRYEGQFNREDYAAFRKEFSIVGTWDDHDYGKNNGNRNFPLKKETRDMALDFFEVPDSDPIRDRVGLYGAYDFGPEGKRTRVILFDGRYFASGPRADDPTLLGEAQKKWLTAQLENGGADLYLFASGIQVLSNRHRYEKWGNYPADREWLLDLIAQTERRVVFLSGDRHIHEISVMEDFSGDYPLMDVTSSGMTHSWDRFPGEPNPYRYGDVFPNLGFGMLRIDWSGDAPVVTAEIIDRKGGTRNTRKVDFANP